MSAIVSSCLEPSMHLCPAPDEGTTRKEGSELQKKKWIVTEYDDSWTVELVNVIF